jgi:hypothetical protein
MVASALFATAAYADPATCRGEILDASKKSLETPNHIYSSTTGSGLVHKSEIINVGNKSYVRVDAKGGKTAIGDDQWAIARVSPQETAKKTIDAMRDAAKETKNYQCAHVRDAVVDGVAAAVYREHAETDYGKSDGEYWISKAQGIILKYESNSNDMAISYRYVYTDIQAPASAKGPGQ